MRQLIRHFIGDERRSKAHIFFSKIKRHRDRSLFWCRWADWQELCLPRLGKVLSAQEPEAASASWLLLQVSQGAGDERLDHSTYLRPWTTRCRWVSESEVREDQNNTSTHFKTWLHASWLLLSTMSERGMRWGCYTVEKIHFLQGYPRDAAWKTWYRTRIRRNDLNPKKEI